MHTLFEEKVSIDHCPFAGDVISLASAALGELGTKKLIKQKSSFPSDAFAFNE
jgi:hypothetical protein